MATDKKSELIASYDEVAEEYVRRIAGELEHKPFDRELLDRYAAMFGANETVCDIGCGPAHVARYLRERGVKVIGVDLSPGMVEHARRLNPLIRMSSTRAGEPTFSPPGDSELENEIQPGEYRHVVIVAEELEQSKVDRELLAHKSNPPGDERIADCAGDEVILCY